MSSAKLMFLLALSVFVQILCAEKTQDTYSDGLAPPNACANCTLCQYPCNAQPPPPSGYESYGAPPPPLPPAQVNCPPSAPVQCCQYSPPAPYSYYPYNNYTGSSCLPIKPSTSTWFLAIFFFSIIMLDFEV